MVPNSVFWESLGVFFAEDLPMSGKLCWHSGDWFGRDGLWVQQYPPNEVSGGPFCPGDIPLPWDESGPFCVICSKDDGQLGMIYPPLFPVNVWLYSCEPGIAQYCLLLP
jgi:hypothetical protein